MSTIPPRPGGPQPGILTLNIKDKSALFSAYMPFVKNGGLFIPTSKEYRLGDEVFILLTLMDSTERLLAWHMRRRHVGVDTDALYRFVPYETPADPTKTLDDEDWPNARLGRSAFNPSRGNFDALVEETELCGAATLE